MSEPALEVTTPHLSHVRIPLSSATTTVGRDADLAARLDDPTVSRRHATIELGHGRMTVHDLGSLNGTYVNGSRIQGSAEIRAGDVVSFGSVSARVAGSDGGRHDVSFQAGQQNANQINMAGRDQINYIRAERESFLADISATKTKGRWLVSFGFLCLAVGFCLFGYGVIAFIQAVPDLGPETQPSDAPSPLGPDVIGGIPLGAIGFALAALGSFTLIAGIVLHVSAAARLRRLQSAPWPPTS
ncbi:FHA domain-containing protein [Actinoplanes sp. NPDC051513]|uniref:FHA domain-containing protein n=1 Tax=Actinoplanes sp. NPDC051513 TaxID=3363908 RepID=UPI0037AF97E2